MSFNLLVAGEFEIVTSRHISVKEHKTRLEVLKRLAYKHESLPVKDILAQYASFLSKVEKGKYKWGSKSTISSFEQQLITATLDRNTADVPCRNVPAKMSECQKLKQIGREERKKYCLDFNKGTCVLQGPMRVH